MSVLVLFQFAGAGECLETFLAGVGGLDCLTSTHHLLLTLVQIIRVVRGAKRELTEILLLLSTAQRTLNYRETLWKVYVFLIFI